MGFVFSPQRKSSNEGLFYAGVKLSKITSGYLLTSYTNFSPTWFHIVKRFLCDANRLDFFATMRPPTPLVFSQNVNQKVVYHSIITPCFQHHGSPNPNPPLSSNNHNKTPP